jgi:hypothetical protein
VNQFCALLDAEKSGDDMLVEKVFYSKVSLESLIIEKVEVLLNTLCISGLGEREVLVVSELAEIFANNVFKII